MGELSKKNLSRSAAGYWKKNPMPYGFGIAEITRDSKGEVDTFQWLTTSVIDSGVSKKISAIVCSVLEYEIHANDLDSNAHIASTTKNDASKILTYAYIFKQAGITHPVFVALKEIEVWAADQEAIIVIIKIKELFDIVCVDPTEILSSLAAEEY